MSKKVEIDIGCGCIPFILFCILLATLIGGFQIGDTRYTLSSCDCDDGVVLEESQ